MRCGYFAGRGEVRTGREPRQGNGLERDFPAGLHHESVPALSPRVSLLIASRVEVKLPAEPMDQYQRPAFIVRNDAGIEVCENRLSCTSLSPHDLE